jgi:AraC family transcriptional regulator
VQHQILPDSWLENHQLSRLQQVLSYIETSLDQPLSVDSLAQKIHWSRWQFQRVFQRETGTSVAQYIRNLRLSYAAKLLLTTQKRQLDIALACGFDSEISFSRSFRKAYQCTPGNYRKRGQYLGLAQPMSLSRPDKLASHLSPKLLQIKIETKPAHTLHGVVGKFNGIFSDNANFAQTVPKLWEQLKTATNMQDLIHPIGIIDLTAVNDSHTDIPYWACINTQDLSLQKKLQTLHIPQQQYAVLPHRGAGVDMVKTLHWFIEEWLPESGFIGVNGFDLEHYCKDFDLTNQQAYMEYWIPVTMQI